MPYWNRFKHWLRAAPIGDPVDRRNAPVMQLLLMFYGVALPSAWAWHLSSRAIPPGWTIVLLLDLTTSTLAFVCVGMIRAGRFRPAMTVFLGALLLSLGLAHFKLGTQSQLIDQSSMILTLVIGGLVLGRRALWTVYGLLMLVFLIGFTVDATNNAHDPQWVNNALSNAPTLAVSYFIITLVLDRTIAALRESLAESNQRGRDLQREMAERERAQARLIQAQKVEATGRLASGISHDFNNILGLIVGYASQRDRILDIADRAAMQAAAHKAFVGIEDAANRGADITRKLLSFSRHEVAVRHSFALGPAIASMQPMLRQLFPRSVELALPEGPTSLQVRFERSEFELMVLNIAANARDAMPDGGVFRIELHADGDEHVAIELSDSGHGMDDSVQRQVFDPFFSTKAANGGTGLGLAVVQDLVIAAGGEISVRSAPGQGTTFRVRLPSG